MKLPLLLLLFCVAARAAGKHLQAASPEPLSAVAGSDVLLPCGLVTFDPSQVTVEWSRIDGPTRLTVHILRNGEELHKEKAPAYVNRTAVAGGGALQLLAVSRRDSGTYSCALWKGSSVEAEAFVSLIVAEVSQVKLTVRRTRTNELFVLCESDGWSPEPRISLQDSAGAELTAEKRSAARPDDLHAVSAAAQVEAGSETFTCRVEIPATRLLKENDVHIIDEFSPSEAGRGSFSFTWQLVLLAVGAGGVLGVALLHFVIRWLRPKLRHHFWDKEKGDQRYSEYGDVRQVETFGASEITALANRLLSRGLEASNELAARDLKEMLKYKDDIVSVGQSLHVHPALIAAIISRQSAAGTTLTPSGYGTYDSTCFGLMQINKNYHAVKGGPFSKEHLDEGVTFFIQLIKTMQRTKPDWTKEQRLKGALACYVAGEERVIPLTYAEVDSMTPNGDFANDVIARAHWFASNGF